MTSGSNPPIPDPQALPPLAAIDVGTLLPQRPPYLLVDRLLHYDEELVRCSFRVPADHLTVDDGHLSPAGVIEHIAQTCAARIGFINRYILHRPVNIGYVAALRDLRLRRLPAVGETLQTEVRVVEDHFGMTLIAARVTSGDTEVATGEMKIALTDRTVGD
jgi:predicted hotdog family 3-hydroxylacyl-ACP dehydratase